MAERMRPMQIAWLAGLLEGEGCFGFSHHIFIALGMTDRDTVAKVAALLNTKLRGPYRPSRGNKDMYYTTAYGYKAASWMMILFSFLSVRRRAVICEALGKWKQQKVQRSLNVESLKDGKQNPAYRRAYREARRAHG